MKLNFSNDLGNGSLKGRINGNLFNMPTLVTKEAPRDISSAKTFYSKTAEAEYMNNYLDHMDLDIQSNVVQDTSRMLVGKSANGAIESPDGFDIHDTEGKSSDSKAIIFTLSAIAGTALKLYYKKYHKLPDSEITANVNMVTALPINEGSDPAVIKAYGDKYRNSNHTVNIRNFRNSIGVKIHFSHVMVKLEGEVAIYDIEHASKSLRESIMDDFQSHYKDSPFGEYVKNVDELIKAHNLVGVDVGEGTTDWPVFTDNHLNVKASSSMADGFGDVLDNARRSRDIQRNYGALHTRSQFKSVLEQTPTGLNRRKVLACKNAVTNELRYGSLVEAIADHLSQVYQDAKGKIDVIFVYGGGAIPMEKYLRPALMKKTQGLRDGGIPVIFVGKQFSQYMNDNGLQLILNSLPK